MGAAASQILLLTPWLSARSRIHLFNGCVDRGTMMIAGAPRADREREGRLDPSYGGGRERQRGFLPGGPAGDRRARLRTEGGMILAPPRPPCNTLLYTEYMC